MDERTRTLERQALTGDRDALEELRAAWLRLHTQVQCPDCQQLVFDADLEEHRAKCCPIEWPNSLSVNREARLVHRERQAEVDAVNEAAGMPLVDIPLPEVVSARPRKNPIYSRETIQPGELSCSFFTHHREIWDQTPGFHGRVPQGHCFYFYGFSLLPDSGNSLEDLLYVRDRGMVRLMFQQTDLLQLPARVVISQPPDEKGVERYEEARLREAWEAKQVLTMNPICDRAGWSARNRFQDVTIMGRPVGLDALMSFQWRLDLPKPLPRPFTSMLVLFGILLKGIVS